MAPELGDCGPVSAAPYGSASILPITWTYIKMMGAQGLRRASLTAIASANYIARRLDEYFPVLYTGENGMVAHECILDLRPLTKETGVTVDDVAKRLADYGFHSPTMSFPVAGTLMVEPTESENLAEIDEFCDAMISIRGEIDRVAAGEWPVDDNPLRGAPHTAECLVSEWNHPYSREIAVFPRAPRGRRCGRRYAGSTVPTATATSCARARRSRRTPADVPEVRAGPRIVDPPSPSADVARGYGHPDETEVCEIPNLLVRSAPSDT